ncbi:MAG: hypothetical protein CSB13_11820 [Chloroflexi bacterium]|nr:MAG: hypothetical protein CSB13_11820 [Chloroflexota bacterium]
MEQGIEVDVERDDVTSILTFEDFLENGRFANARWPIEQHGLGGGLLTKMLLNPGKQLLPTVEGTAVTVGRVGN